MSKKQQIAMYSFKFMVKIMLGKNNRIAYNYLLKAMLNNLKFDEQSAKNILDYAISQGYFSHKGNTVYLKKKACDKIREWNALDERIEKAQQMNADAHAVL